ncbi:MAG TPA: hypothetical protein VF469_25565 [Kofleriaceae bacterium]
MTKPVRAERIANDSPFCEAHSRVDDLIKQLTSTEAMRATLGDIERLLAKEGRVYPRNGPVVHRRALRGRVAGRGDRRRWRRAAHVRVSFASTTQLLQQLGEELIVLCECNTCFIGALCKRGTLVNAGATSIAHRQPRPPGLWSSTASVIASSQLAVASALSGSSIVHARRL